MLIKLKEEKEVRNTNLRKKNKEGLKRVEKNIGKVCKVFKRYQINEEFREYNLCAKVCKSKKVKNKHFGNIIIVI